MLTAYSVQRISRFSSTPVARYSKRSIGRRAKSRKVRSPLNTRAMNTPSGLVIARIKARNTKICIQPLLVISEFLRSQKRIQQVDHQTGAHQQHNDRFSIHMDWTSDPQRIRSQNCTYASDSRKNATVTTTKIMSCTEPPPIADWLCTDKQGQQRTTASVD